MMPDADNFMDDLLDDIREDLGEEIAYEAKKKLDEPVSREGVRSNWKDGRPLNSRFIKYTSKPSTSGALKRSIESEVIGETIILKMLHYGEQVDLGRKKGRFPNVSAIQRWVVRKPVRPDKDIGAEELSFLIARKIRWFGTDGTKFIERAINEVTR